MKILIVGAQEGGPKSLVDLLEDRGHDVRVVVLSGFDPSRGSGAADIVVVDLVEEVELGLAAIRKLVGSDGRPLLVVAHAEADHLEFAVNAGADDFIVRSLPTQVNAARLALCERRVKQAIDGQLTSDALKSSHANLLALVENTDDFVLFSDRSGSPVFFNRAYAGLMKAALGLEMKPGIKFHELLPDPDARAAWEGYHRRVLGGERFRAEHVHVLADGTELFVEVRYEPVFRDGAIIGFSEFSRDITAKMVSERALEAKVAERTNELRASEERYRTVYDTAPLAFVLWDCEGRVVDWNRHAEQVFGYERAEMLGVALVGRVVPDEARDRVESLMRKLVRGQGPFRTTDELLTKRGDKILCEWSHARLFDSHGEVLGVMSLGLDVTEQRQLEERIRRAEKMEAIGQLAGGIAHDFNNQLVGVMGYADMLKRNLRDERMAEYAHNILRSARRSAELVSQLLAFARKGKYLSTPVDLHSVVGEVISLLERSIDKRITVERCFEASSACTLGDPTQIQNAFLNLAINARDAMPDGGILRFETSIRDVGESRGQGHQESCAPGRYICVRITDTGVGMPRATIDRIFEPFFTTKKQGTGMGLAAVYGTVRSHRGYIQVDSAPGKGTTFEVLFPMHDEEAEEPKESYRYVQPSSRAHVLVIDDEAMVCELAADMIRALGHRATTCCDVGEAIRRYAEIWRDVDIVILDMVMPRMTGREALGELRKVNSAVKVVLSSGYAIDRLAPDTPGSGDHGFLQKPYDLGALAKIIRDLQEG